MEGAVSRVGSIWEYDGWRWSDGCGSDFGRIAAIWKASVRPSRGWSWVVGYTEGGPNGLRGHLDSHGI